MKDLPSRVLVTYADGREVVVPYTLDWARWIDDPWSVLTYVLMYGETAQRG